MFLSQIMTSESAVVLRYAKLTKNALPPTRESPRAVGFDLKSAYNVVIPAGGNGIGKNRSRDTNSEIYYGRIIPRSGLALHQLIKVGRGVVDEDYHGNLCVILFNHSDKLFHIHRGDRVAQITC
jgi:dUTP pyrophosphatase